MAVNKMTVARQLQRYNPWKRGPWPPPAKMTRFPQAQVDQAFGRPGWTAYREKRNNGNYKHRYVSPQGYVYRSRKPVIEDFGIKRLELFDNNLVLRKSAGKQMKKAVKRSKESQEVKNNMQCLQPASASSDMKSVQNIVESKSVKSDGFVRRASNINATKKISEVYKKRTRSIKQSKLFDNNLKIKKSDKKRMKNTVESSKKTKIQKSSMQCIESANAMCKMQSEQKNISATKSVKDDGFVRRASNINATRKISEVYNKKARTKPKSLETPSLTKRQLKMEEFCTEGSSEKTSGERGKNEVDCKQRKHGPTSAENREAAKQEATTARNPKKNGVDAKLSAAKRSNDLDGKENVLQSSVVIEQQNNVPSSSVVQVVSASERNNASRSHEVAVSVPVEKCCSVKKQASTVHECAQKNATRSYEDLEAAHVLGFMKINSFVFNQAQL